MATATTGVGIFTKYLIFFNAICVPLLRFALMALLTFRLPRPSVPLTISISLVAEAVAEVGMKPNGPPEDDDVASGKTILE